MYFCAGAPQAHCAKVKKVAPVDEARSAITGTRQMLPQPENWGQKAGESRMPRSAGFSIAQSAPTS